MNNPRHYYSLIFQKSLFELVAESRRGYLGMLWWVVEPLLYMSVFYLVFVVIFDRGGEGHVVFLLTGIVVWKLIGSSIPQCATSIQSNAGLIRQMYIPKHLFPVMVLTVNLAKFLVIFPLLALFVALMVDGVSLSWLMLPLLMFIQCILILAAGMFLASIIPFFPDFKLIVDNSMTLLFFMSGVIFDISSVSEKVKFYLYLNPFAVIIKSYRDILIDGAWPDFYMLSIVAAVSCAGLYFSYLLIRRNDHHYAKLI